MAKSYYEFPQIFPKPGWVEHNPFDIWNTTKKTLNDVISSVGIDNVVSIGITNQRETAILWNRKIGEPVYNAIVWQCRRTKVICEQLSKYCSVIKEKTGLLLDPYFSATKIKWVIENIKCTKEQIENEAILFGTVDS